jgi:hypothetical protein
MSWSIHPEVKGVRVPDAKGMVDGMTNVPQTIKDYIMAGLDGLGAIHGEDVLVTVTGHGHLCTGKDYEVTSATIEVKKVE